MFSFQKLNGNRASYTDDGYNFRGRGLIQITGYEKYSRFMAGYDACWGEPSLSTVGNLDLINEMPVAIWSAMWFWLAYKIYDAERGEGYSDVERVTARVNGGGEGLDRRKMAYKAAGEVISEWCGI